MSDIGVFIYFGPQVLYQTRKIVGINNSHRLSTACICKQTFLSLTSQGLIAVNDGSFGNGSQWRFASQAGADFSDKGISSNLTSEATTLFRGVDGNRVGVQQSMVVQKSLEQRAQEAAEMIFELRKKRVQIVTGDTDATYSGEAMNLGLVDRVGWANGKAKQLDHLSAQLRKLDVAIQTVNFTTELNEEP